MPISLMKAGLTGISTHHVSGSRDDALQEMVSQANIFAQSEDFRRLLLKCMPDAVTPDMYRRLSTTIHPHDQMLLHSLRHHGDPYVALSQYYNVALQQYRAMRQIMHLTHSEPTDSLRILDFACGFGRLLRFLGCTHPTANLHASEIQPEALQFVNTQFQIGALTSRNEPTDFQPAMTFNLIWVASLFSHLPDRLFRGWLTQLISLLEEDGVLCFSVHDAALMPKDCSLPDSGILFRPDSENPALANSHYGTSYVSEGYVRAAVTQATSGDAGVHCVRIPKGLAHEQDIYVVSRAGLDALHAFRRGPWGWVDERFLGQDGRLYLRGWAASLDDGPLNQVSIMVNGEHHQCPTGQSRLDVGEVFQNPNLSLAGWSFELPLAKGIDAARVEVIATSDQGEQALLYCGTITPVGAPPPFRDMQSGSLLQRLVARWRHPK